MMDIGTGSPPRPDAFQPVSPSGDMAGRRRELRQPVLRTAKILFGGSLIDCLVHNISRHGIGVTNETFVKYPETVTIELRAGGRRSAFRRWQRGCDTGFEFTAFAGLTGEAAERALQLHERLRNAGTHDVTRELARNGWYDNAELQEAATAADAAITLLEQVLMRASGEWLRSLDSRS